MKNLIDHINRYRETLPNGEVRYKIIKPRKIDDRLWISSDPYNLILLDYETIKPRRHYYSSTELLSRGIVELKAKDLLGKDWASLGGMDELVLSYDALIHKMSGQLEEYIKELITTGED